MKKALLMTAALVMLSSGAFAEEHKADGVAGKHGKMHEKMQEHMKEVDTNGDGQIDRAEFLAQAGKRFDAMDKDGDGVLTKEEKKAHHEGMRDKMKDKMKDKKGKWGKGKGQCDGSGKDAPDFND